MLHVGKKYEYTKHTCLLIMCAVNQRKQVPTVAAHPERTESEGLKPIVSVAQTHRLITPFGCSKCSLSLSDFQGTPASREEGEVPQKGWTLSEKNPWETLQISLLS